MPRGFFSKVELNVVESPTSRVPKCAECGLYRNGCKSPKMAVAGKGRRKVLVVGEAPGATEDEKGKPFVGKSGRELQRVLKSIGVDLFRDCWVTNAVICRPEANATPDDKTIEYCRPNVVNAIEKLDPETIILLGNVPLQSVITWLWGQNPGAIKRWAGVEIASQKPNAWVHVVNHPSYVLREDNRALDVLFRQQLKAAFRHHKRPWRRSVDYLARVRAEIDDARAYQLLRSVVQNATNAIAFDYETNMKKPDSSRARIVSCAVSNGNVSVAFPWRGRCAAYMKDVLQSSIPKIAANLKFEHRWTRRVLGIEVNNWLRTSIGDTMIGAHVLDNRHGVSGLEFQAFVKLGQREWSSHVSPYLRSKKQGGYAENRIQRCDLRDLLTYNGLDALLEYHLARVQSREIGV